MRSYPSRITESDRALIMLADALRRRRAQLGTRWRRLDAQQQALLVVAQLRKGGSGSARRRCSAMSKRRSTS